MRHPAPHLTLVTALLLCAACGRLGFDEGPSDSGAGDPDASTTEVTVSERQGADRTGVEDSTIKDYDPTINFQSAGFLGAWADRDGAPSTPGVLRFDVSSLAGATVVSAELELALHLDLNTAFTPAAISALELREDWLGAEVTYENRRSGQPWSSPGATGDVRGMAVGSAVGVGDRVTMALDVAVVQRWIDSPDTNSGVTLIEAGGDGLGVWFCSSEFGDLDRRPQLTLEIAP